MQKTAYDMRISDWSSDVCSSDLALCSLPVLDTAIWRHEDGTRVRALRYSASHAAATALVPAGCWLEDQGNGAARVCGADGEWEGIHSVKEIAICIAALKARIDVDEFSA